jgi:hypothetical protein
MGLLVALVLACRPASARTADDLAEWLRSNRTDLTFVGEKNGQYVLKHEKLGEVRLSIDRVSLALSVQSRETRGDAYRILVDGVLAAAKRRSMQQP